MRQVEEQPARRCPSGRALFTATGLGFGGPGRVTDGFVFLNLKPRDERERTQQEIVQALFPQLLCDPRRAGLRDQPAEPRRRLRLDARSSTCCRPRATRSCSRRVGIDDGRRPSKLGYLVNLDTDLRLNKPQLDIAIDRERAAGLGVSVTDIGTHAGDAASAGAWSATSSAAPSSTTSSLQCGPTDRATPDVDRGDLRARAAAAWCSSPTWCSVRGDGGAQGAEPLQPRALGHHHREPRARAWTSARRSTTWTRSRREDLPPGVKRDLAGQSREFRESSGSLYFLFVLARRLHLPGARGAVRELRPPASRSCSRCRWRWSGR